MAERKLSDEQVLAIVDMCNDNVPKKKIAEVYGVSQVTVYKIAQGEVRSKVTGIVREIKTMDDYPELEFRKIPGYPGYYATRCGKIFSDIQKSFREMTYSLDTTTGYLVITLGRRFGSRYVHRLICAAFKGDSPEDKQCACHKDGDKLNNHANNLYWGSPADNSGDMVRHGNSQRGERHHHNVLTEGEVIEIKRLISDNLINNQEIGDRYGVSRSTIHSIRRNKSWVWVEIPGKNRKHKTSKGE